MQNFFFFPGLVEFLLQHLRQPWSELALAAINLLGGETLLVNLQIFFGQANFFRQGDYLGVARAEILLHGFEFGAGIEHALRKVGLGIYILSAQTEAVEQQLLAGNVGDCRHVLTQILAVAHRRLKSGQRGFVIHSLFLRGDERIVEEHGALHHGVQRFSFRTEPQVG